jgi:hypothetical protein
VYWLWRSVSPLGGCRPGTVPAFGDAVARLKRSAGDPGALVRQPFEPSQPAPKCETKLHREIFSGQTIVRQH